jgi:hypothetical protein
VLGWAAAALAGVAVAANGVGDRQIVLDEAPLRAIDAGLLRQDEAHDRLGIGTTPGGEFLPRDVQIAVYTTVRNRVRDFAFPRDRAVFERLYPERDWLGGALYPLDGDLRFLGWQIAPLRLGVRVANDAPHPATVGVRQLRFAGWRAWVDGRPVPIEVPPPVPEQQAALGLMAVAVPPGEHTVSLAFGPTAPRLAGLALTAGGALAALAGLAWFLGRRRGAPHVGLAAAWLLLAAGLGALLWRAVWPAMPALAAPPVAPAAFAGGVWRAPGLAGGGAGLVVNVAEAVRTGRARVDSPAGAALGPERFVDVRQLTVRDLDDPERGAPGTSRRQWLYLHPPSEVAVDVALPARPGLTFQAALALDPATWSTSVGDGVRFRATVTPLDAAPAGPAVVVLDQVINPRANADQRRWVPVLADLSPWAGTTVRMALRTDPRDDLSFDWAGWGNPVVSVWRDSARASPVPAAP